MLYFKVLLFLMILNVTAFSQSFHSSVFKDLREIALFTAVVNEYKTFTVLDYSMARDTLFKNIDAVNDSLECIYTGMTLYLPPDQDPTQAVFLNGIPNGINTEHVYPESKGARNMGRSDMHNLYPSRVKTNSDRANNPMGEIPDEQTKIWYYKTTELNFPPAINRDLYSESIPTKFEPRESVKGNVARSIFYIYTMYRPEATNADPLFFDIQVADLCDWHFQDPVDETEWSRTFKIAAYQGGKVNPFVLDCSLAARLYCDHISQACNDLVLSSTKDIAQEKWNLTAFPNPGETHINIALEITRPSSYRIVCHDILGRHLFEIYNGNLDEGRHTWTLPENLSSGTHVVRVYDQNNHQSSAKLIQKR